jgi:CheY-like chemotaxis protein
MLCHAAVTHPVSPRGGARPLRRPEWHNVRSDAGPRSDDRRRYGRGDLPTGQPLPLQKILVGRQVLVVDDDADVLELFAVALTACGADVTTTDNARDAIALAARLKPHAIVSDIAMVGEDGYWLVRELKRLPADVLGDVPVIAATAYGTEHPRVRVLAAGFAEHLQKPVDPELLCRVVARLATH